MSEIDLQLPHGTTHKQYIVDLEAQLAAARAEIVRLNDLREVEVASARRQMTKQAVEIEQLRTLAKEGEKP